MLPVNGQLISFVPSNHLRSNKSILSVKKILSEFFQTYAQFKSILWIAQACLSPKQITLAFMAVFVRLPISLDNKETKSDLSKRKQQTTFLSLRSADAALRDAARPEEIGMKTAALVLACFQHAPKIPKHWNTPLYLKIVCW